MGIIGWTTLLSDCSELYFVNLVHDNTLRLTVDDRSNERYEVEIHNPGPYRVVDEQYLIKYWGSKAFESTRWTFVVEGGFWQDIPVELLDIYMPVYTHYVIATWDYCLEVLSQNEPTIRKVA